MRGSLLLSSSIELQQLMHFSGFFLERAVYGAQSFGNGHLNGGFLFSVKCSVLCTLGGCWK